MTNNQTTTFVSNNYSKATVTPFFEVEKIPSNLENLTLEKMKSELEALQLRIAEEEKKHAAKSELDEYAATLGYTIEQLYGPFKAVGSNKSGSSRRQPKYQNPNVPKSTWCGTGVKPAWVKALEAEGKDIEDYKYVKNS